MIAQTTRAILLAMATLATRAGLRASKARRRGSAASGLCRARRIREVAPITRSFLRYRSPILVMRPSRSFPPLEFCDGVRPSQAANSRPERNCAGLATDAASAVAPTGLITGMVDSMGGRRYASKPTAAPYSVGGWSSFVVILLKQVVAIPFALGNLSTNLEAVIRHALIIRRNGADEAYREPVSFAPIGCGGGFKVFASDDRFGES